MSSGLFRRAASIVLAAGLLTGGLTLVSAPQAAASTSTVTPLSVAYIDSVLPSTSLTPLPTGNMPVGASFPGEDGQTHVSKSYFTFDLSAFRGATLSSVTMFATETMVNNCNTTLDTEAWLTSTARKPTWNNQPTEQTQLAGPNGISGCPSGQVSWDGLAAIGGALTAGRSTVTIALRLPDDQQSNPTFGRHYNPAVTITIDHNRLPDKPGALTVNNAACTTTPHPVGRGTITLGATLTDPDNDQLTAQFVYWLVKQPDQRVELDQRTFPTSPPSPTQVGFDGQTNLEDGATYAWQVRGVDAQGPGPWSAVCRFSTDFTSPGSAPTVTSTDYPAGQTTGGTGVPGTFTFGARGVKDVVSYRYDFTPGGTDTFVPATTKGGTATIQFTPTSIGPNTLLVQSVDGVGNQSPMLTYNFNVADNLPTVSCTPTEAIVGVPRQCVFGPGVNTGVTSYTYQLDTDATTTVPAGPDGTATVSITPSVESGSPVQVRVTATLGNGITTGAGQTFLFVDPADPIVSQTPNQPIVGQPVTFSFQPVQPGVVSYTYTVNNGAPVTVPAQTDGTATVSITPTASGFLDLQVFSTDGNGVRSGTTDNFSSVQSNHPTVSSTDYPEFTFGGGVGIAGTFTFSSPVPGVVSYTYVFNRAAPVTVAAGADGTLALVLTPSTGGQQDLTVTSTFTDGTVSEPNTYTFFVSATAPSARATRAQ
jgi:hypothetical protein